MTVRTIRPATAEDADRLQRIYAAVVADTAISFEESPPDADEMRRRMVAEPRLPWLVADRGGEVAGYAYAALHRQRPAYRWSAECSVYVDAAHRSQGVGRLLYERLIEEVRGLGYVSLFAGIALPNPGSVALHEAVGFRPIGIFPEVGYKHGRWHDVGWWRNKLVDPPVRPAEPRTWEPEAHDG
jgi:L-amino acid N-acyltransferase YncA